MIWHFVEVWVLIAVTFVFGCVLGSIVYGFLAESRLATAQGVVADHVGDILDRVKARVGLGPAWRPTHLRRVERPLPVPAPLPDPVRYDPAEDATDHIVEEAAYVAPVEETRRLLPQAEAQIAPEPRRRRFGPPRRALPAIAPQAELDLPVPAIALIAAKRPAGINAPRGGVPDNLQRIKGIGKRNEQRLNALGIFHFGQIAAWTPGEARWIGEHLELADRIERDGWMAQATVLAMGTDTGFEKSAERRRQRRKHEREFQARMVTAGEPPPPDILPPRSYDDVTDDEPEPEEARRAPEPEHWVPDPAAALEATYQAYNDAAEDDRDAEADGRDPDDDIVPRDDEPYLDDDEDARRDEDEPRR